MSSNSAANRRVLGLFADILEYPHTSILEPARECEALVSDSDADAGVLLRQFREFVEATPHGEQQEIYTTIFDLDSDCHPYLGYQLFGESYERSAFMLELKARYREGGFQANASELPDRLSEVLRFLSVGSDESANDEILQEGVLPALDKLTSEDEADETELDAADLELEKLRPQNDPYSQVLEALQLVLEPLRAVTVPAAGVSAREERING